MPTVTEGLTKIQVATLDGIVFKATGAATHAGIPFIRSIQENNIMEVSGIDSDGVIKTHTIVGNTGVKKSSKRLKATQYRAYLPESAGRYSIGPWGSVGYLYVENLNSYLGSGNVIKYKRSGTVKGIDKRLPSTHKLLGFIPNSLQTKAMVITVEDLADTIDPEAGFSHTDCNFYLIDTLGEILSSGTIPFESVSIYTFGMGRGAQVEYSCSVMELVTTSTFGYSGHVWAAKGDGTWDVTLWTFVGGAFLTLMDTASTSDGLSDGSYEPAHPSIIEISGRVLIIAADIVYRYSRTSFTGMGYDDTKTWLGEILRTESYYSGLINDFTFDSTPITDLYPDTLVAMDENINDASFYGMIINDGPIRDNLEKIRAIGYFDIMSRGYSIMFKGRATQTPVDVYTYDGENYTNIGNIPAEHMGCFEGSDDTVSSFTQEMRSESELPKKLEFDFIDIFRNYEINRAASISEESRATNIERISTPLVMSYSQALNTANVIRHIRWAERSSFKFTLPPIYCTLETDDVVNIDIPFDEGFLTFPVKITSINNRTNGLLDVSATATASPIYTVADEEATPDLNDDDTFLTEASFGELLDVPAILPSLEETYAHMAFATGISDTWNGASLARSDDEGASYINAAQFTLPCTMGNVKTTGAVVSGALIDRSEGITVEMIYGEPATISDDEFKFDTNLAFWGNGGVGWEVIKFRDAAFVSGTTYTISHMQRGLWGTEWMITEHLVDDLFILINNNGRLVGVPQSSLDFEKPYKLVDVGNNIKNSPEDMFTYEGVNLMPFSPVRATVEDGVGVTNFYWVRRSRYDNGWQSSIDVPLNEEREYYEVDVCDGSWEVVNTYPVFTTTFAYGDSMQTTDFGGVQTTFRLRIYQMSAKVGRGYPLEVTLNV